ncbi:unnamed protein product [Ixodes hexagonus]
MKAALLHSRKRCLSALESRSAALCASAAHSCCSDRCRHSSALPHVRRARDRHTWKPKSMHCNRYTKNARGIGGMKSERSSTKYLWMAALADSMQSRYSLRAFRH